MTTRLHFFIAVTAICLSEIHGHGKMTDPLNRSSLGTSGKYPQAVPNNEDNQNYCGGIAAQYNEVNKGKCGPCGDNFQDPVPRNNENGGLYGIGVIVKQYRAGEKINVTVDVTAKHEGHFEFSICKLRNDKDVETDECFDEHRLQLVNKDGQINYKYYPISESKVYMIEVLLPENLKCERCVMRWHYRVGNNWGWCDKKQTHGDLGCGDQETFRSCADITIV